MKVLYSPEFDGRVFLGLNDSHNNLMDVVVCDTVSLVRLLEMQLGVYEEDRSAHYRMVKYFEALSKYMNLFPDNVLIESFHLSGLATATQVLNWRDNLVFDGLLIDAPEKISSQDKSRLAVIEGTEQFFDCPGWADRVWKVIAIIEDAIRLESPSKIVRLFTDWEIVLPCKLDLLHPTVQRLMRCLKQCGAQIDNDVKCVKNSQQNNLAKIVELLQSADNKKITLDKVDRSFEIYRFADDRLANEYFAYKGDRMGVDVWINSANKSMDNWLRLMGKPTMGSSMEKVTPQLLQLFVMGIDTLREPLNIYSLINWLYCPMQPLGTFFGSVLAEAIISEGGYRNDRCREIVNDYIEGTKYVFRDKEDDENLTEEEIAKRNALEKKKRKQLVDTYLPQLEVPQDMRLTTERLKFYLNSLGSWARSRAHWLGEIEGNEGWCRQLNSLSDMCDTFVLLVDSSNMDKWVDEKQMESWISTLNRGETFALYPAQKGSMMLIDSPAKMASRSGRTVWMNFVGGENRALDCGFLYPSERTKLSDRVVFWDDVCEAEYNQQMQLLPFVMTNDKLLLVTTDYVQGEPTQKHPLMVRLESQIENFADFVVEPNLYVEEDGVAVEHVNNKNNSAQIEFSHADLIKWPEHLSPTTISTFVEYPFDYMMERMLKIENTGPNSVKDIKATKGSVAHGVIERLFAPRDGKRCSTIDELAHRVDAEFEMVFRQQIEACGAILYLPENKIDAELLRQQLQKCVVVLLRIIKDNRLSVVGCEQQVLNNMDLIVNDKGWDMIGYIDMTLEDEAHRLVVFDFKWTTSKSFYYNLLTQNKSTQLELYRAMLGSAHGKSVERTAYFLMPEGHLYSKEFFVGEHCTQIVPGNDDDIVAQLRRSFRYRKEQFERGVVEIGDNFNFELLDYFNDTVEKGLFPLQNGEETIKPENRFSNYGLFK